MPTVAQVRSSLSRYAGANNTFLDRLNEVRARLIQGGGWKGTKRPLALTVYADADGNSIVTLPPDAESILKGKVVNSANVLCGGMPMGVRNEFDGFDDWGLSENFHEVSGRFAVYQEWTGGMYIRLYFEAVEDAGTVHLFGAFEGDDVYSLYSGTWIRGEKIAFVGSNTYTTTKKFEAAGFSATKPVTKGRVFVSAVDDDGNTAEVAVWEPSETVPRRKRYRVPQCEDTDVVVASASLPESEANQSYTKEEFDAMFNGSASIAVSAAGTTALDYASFFLRVVKITAAAGAGAYTHKFPMPTNRAKNGAIFRVKLEIAQSANPRLQFYNESISGTLLQEVFGDSSNPIYRTLEFSFNGSAWVFDAP